jgi:4-hydroxybenzoate polyprenyltransferase
MDEDGFGAGTWVKMFAVLIGVGVAVFLTFVLATDALLRWGFIGGFVVIGVVLLLAAWLYDKRERKKDAEWGLLDE